MSDATPTERKPLLNEQQYQWVKFITTVILPAAGTLYAALSGIWGLPNPEAVVGTIVAVVAFLGIFLNRAEASYNKSDARYDGSVDVTTNANGGTAFSLNLNGDPMELKDQKEVKFKVNPILGG